MAGRDNGAGRGQGTVRAGLSLGRVGGIQVRVDWSAAVIFALIAVGLAVWQFPAANPRQAPLAYVLAGVLTTLVFLASLLAHELAHSLVARHYRLRVNGITLWLFGGISKLGGEAPSPAAEARIWADRAGQALGTICIAGGLYVFFLTRDVSWLWISLIGWFLAGAATTEAQQAVLAGCNLTI